MPAPTLEGALDLVIKTGPGQAPDVTLSSSRPIGIAKVLNGKPVEEALSFLPRLFPVCGQAHAFAGLEAVEDALGLEVDPAHLAARDLLRQAETLKSHAWFFLLDWPRREGLAPLMSSLAPIKQALEKLPDALYPDGDWTWPGGGRLAPELETATALVESALDHLRDGLGENGAIAFDTGYLAPFFARLEESGLAGFGATRDAFLPDLAREALFDTLKSDLDHSFARQPSWNGEMYETGPLARMCRDKAACTHDGEHTIQGRLTARLQELILLMDALPGIIKTLSHGAKNSNRLGGSGEGLGVTEAARGRLTHWVAIKEGCIDRYAILAPTEWNFHPQGPLVQALIRARDCDADTLEKGAAMLVTAMDPCVSCTVTVERTP